MVVNYTASWCPACRSAWPNFAKLSSELIGVSFVKVNVDVGRELTEGIKSIPTFRVYSNGEQVANLVGYNEQGIRDALKSRETEPAPPKSGLQIAESSVKKDVGGAIATPESKKTK